MKKIGKTKIKAAGASAPKRNPARTKERILLAALEEFAHKGLAGARVDSIARRAAVNKRMLYHYFADKEGLFREVLRRKMAERAAWASVSPENPFESLPFWFDLACRDLDWVRLLEWEALHVGDGPVMEEPKRKAAARQAIRRIEARQRNGHLAEDLDARYVALALMAVTTFPIAFPQMTRLLTGLSTSDPRFQSQATAFLRRFARGFRPPEQPQDFQYGEAFFVPAIRMASETAPL